MAVTDLITNKAITNIPINRAVNIGIFVTDKKIILGTKPGRMRLGMLNPETSQENAQIFYFSLKDIDYEKYLIDGIYYDREQECWIDQSFSFPDIIYMRGVPDLRDKELLRFLDLITLMKLRLVNKLLMFNKWDVHQLLREHCEIRPHLPETRLFHSRTDDLMPMLRRYGRVYLKACQGRQGRQVLRVTKLPGSYYEYNYFAARPVTGKVSGGSLSRMIQNFFNKQNFIIQQPINLINYSGGKVDLRAEVQRNGRGQLEVVAVPVRVGRVHSPITTHASSYPFDDFFSIHLGYSPTAVESLQKKLHHLLILIYETIEKTYGSFGEMGIDIGLDKNNRLWFIECNSQSAKVSLMSTYRGQTLLKAFTNPLDYAYFIASSLPLQ